MVNPDRWLIDNFYEPIGWRSEYYLNINCFGLAVVCGGFHILAVIWSIRLIGEVPPITTATLGMAWMALSMVVIHHGQIVLSRPQLMNYWKPHWIMRLLIVLMQPFTILPHWHQITKWLVLADVVCMVTIVSVFYFAACNPMPPGWRPRKRLVFAPQAT